uniref:Uncharacterized protein n=1 Tax=Arundo donax TaxID=35708 RepID=A0A0A9DXC0_ARUDO
MVNQNRKNGARQAITQNSSYLFIKEYDCMRSSLTSFGGLSLLTHSKNLTTLVLTCHCCDSEATCLSREYCMLHI